MHSTTHILPAAAVGIALLAAGCGGSVDSAAEAATATDALPAGRIAFRRYLDVARTRGAVFTVKPNGTGEKQITDPPAGFVDDQPDWSHDGKRIAFERCNDEAGCSVWTVAASGGAAHEVHARCHLGPVCDVGSPSWTPDGRLVVSIAQGRVRTHGDADQIEEFSAELIDPKRHSQRTIIKRTDWTGDTAQPAVAPDGHSIVYKRWNSWLTKPAGGRSLYVVNLDGSHNHRVTPWRLQAGDHPGFSPDGSKVLFHSFDVDNGPQADFWTVHPSGRRLAQLTHFKEGTLVLSASYSPDGAWIVYATNGIDDNADVFVMRAHGTGNRPVTRSKLWDSAPDWGPAGS